MPAPAKQRLIVCLDGTWNNRDDSTNVLHQSVLSLEGETDDGWMQRVYYGEGVGNGVLDGVTGGGFGIGLEENVRDAYDWLVENFNDTLEPKYAADEIHIFGFSRGAYTARSLVGFIGRCGLLRRGAPMTVNELWSAYCLLGRQHEERTSFWDKLTVEPRPPFRQISDLVRDPWQGGNAKHTASLTPTEELLINSSRRVRITYLGIYDTVGAMGLDALAIPGLRSKIALHHNMRPTTLIQHCRHALAIDEHRSSFKHTPYVAYYGHAHSDRELERNNEGDETAAPASTSKWQQNESMWRRKIEQRWFVGAHSNIGGGYESNTLAQLPFVWIFDGAKELKLKTKPFSSLNPSPGELPPPNDSYTAFAAPIGIHVLRLKRNYRVIAPPDDIRAARPDPTGGTHVHSGFTLKSVNETIDESVLDYYEAKPSRALPPNLARIAALPESGERWHKLRARSHVWEQSEGVGRWVTPLWGAFAAAGLQAVTYFFSGGQAVVPTWLLMVAAFGFVWVDWLESRLNFTLAVEGLDTASSAACRATKDSIYWTRAIGVVLAVIGGVTAAVNLWSSGWHAHDFWSAATHALGLMIEWSLMIGAGCVAVLIGIIADSAGKFRTSLAAVPVSWAIIFAGIAPAWLCRRVLGISLSVSPIPSFNWEPAALGGQVLLLQLGFAYFFRALLWVGEPLGRINLPSIFQLQLCATPAGVAAVLANWRRLLVCEWRDDDAMTGPAAVRMRTVTSEALWRDIVGFIPVYSVVFGYGLWLASRWMPPTCPFAAWLADIRFGLPGWLWIAVATAAADWLEDTLHLGYLRQHANGESPNALQTAIAFASTVAKFAGFATGLLASVSAVLVGSWRLFELGPRIEWRGSIAVLVTLGTLCVFGATVLTWLVAKIWKKQHAAD